MSKYEKWILFTKASTFEDAYVKIGIKEFGGYVDCLRLRDNIIICGIFPCVANEVTLRIYWREK